MIYSNRVHVFKHAHVVAAEKFELITFHNEQLRKCVSNETVFSVVRSDF
jgi:hypothetical protein